MVKSSGLHFISVGLVDNLLEYLKFNDEDVRLAAARSFRFLSSNPNIKPKLKAMSAVTTTNGSSSEFCLFVVGY